MFAPSQTGRRASAPKEQIIKEILKKSCSLLLQKQFDKDNI